jgi:hypothetical protein
MKVKRGSFIVGGDAEEDDEELASIMPLYVSSCEGMGGYTFFTLTSGVARNLSSCSCQERRGGTCVVLEE